MSTKKLPDLSRTIAALAKYDAEIERLDKELFTCDGHAEQLRVIGEIEALEKAVGEAYGLDTSDRNNPQTCAALVRPGPKNPAVGSELSFVRRMVALKQEGG